MRVIGWLQNVGYADRVFLGLVATLLPPLAALGYLLRKRLVLRLNERYAATDRGRLLVLVGGRARAFLLPAPDRMTTTKTGREEGRIEIRVARLDGTDERIVLHDVGYPSIALETLRAAAWKEK